jgi:hypothetical protein
MAAAACGGGDAVTNESRATAPGSVTASAATPPAAPSDNATSFRGDGSKMPSWGGWAYGNVPADAIAKAGFDWFETGYPDADMPAVNATLARAGVRPFAYINLGELDTGLAKLAGYTGPILGSNSDWSTQLIDVTDASWQAWIVRRAEEAYGQGSRGVKWDVATPSVPPGKTRDDVNAAIASLVQQIRARHPDMKFVYNQGASFVMAHPELADGFENEGLFSASSYAAAWLQPWLDPYFWGREFQDAAAIRALGVPVIIAEYFDPTSPQAQQLYDAILAQGMVPYITSSHWNVRGKGLNVNPGW